MRALVTGGAGFIGSHLAARLVADGHDVRVLDNFATGPAVEHRRDRRRRRARRGRHPELRARAQGGARLRDRLPPGGAAVGPALDPGSADEQRDERHRHAERPARGARRGRAARRLRLVVVGLRREPGAAQARGHAGAADLARTRRRSSPAEGYCRSFGIGYGLETVALRYFNVFGPRQDPTSQYAAVIPNFIAALLDNRPVTIFGDGEQSRDFTHVDNVVQANLLAMDAPDVSGRVFNVACGAKVTLNELVAELRELTGIGRRDDLRAAAAGRRAALARRPDARTRGARLRARGRPARGADADDRALSRAARVGGAAGRVTSSPAARGRADPRGADHRAPEHRRSGDPGDRAHAAPRAARLRHAAHPRQRSAARGLDGPPRRRARRPPAADRADGPRARARRRRARSCRSCACCAACARTSCTRTRRRPGTLGRLAALVPGRGRPRVTVHTFHGHSLTGLLLAPARPRCFAASSASSPRRTTRLIAVSEEVRDDLVRLGVAPAGAHRGRAARPRPRRASTSTPAARAQRGGELRARLGHPGRRAGRDARRAARADQARRPLPRGRARARRPRRRVVSRRRRRRAARRAARAARSPSGSCGPASSATCRRCASRRTSSC